MESERRKCEDAVLHGHNVLILGQAGTGKSALLRELGIELKKIANQQLLNILVAIFKPSENTFGKKSERKRENRLFKRFVW